MHILRFALALLLATGLACPAIKAQENIPADPNTTIGRLENGLTYYLRHNDENKGCADFYIIHNVGALQEEDNQNGLAHFLEHMAFNGTERYPDKTILNFLEKDGVRFGYNVNAYTSRTETVYNISAVPLARESFVDSVLFVLHDWSCAITCDQDALDAERGVISEEWRRKDEPRALMAELQNNLTYKGAKHTKRNVLGTLEIINGFKRQDILDFYHKWYRPDLQAIAVVGDIDVEDLEARVKKIFSSIPAQENPAQKETYEIPAQNGPLFEHMLHPMIKVNTLKVLHKQAFPARETRSTTGFYKDMALRQVATEILKERYNRETAKDDCPAKHIAVVTSRLSADFYTTLFTISPKKDNLQEESLFVYALELKKMLEHGFSADELEAAKFQAAKRINNGSQETVKNGEWIKSCLEHFLRGEALISPIEKKEIQSMMIEEATAEEVFEYMKKIISESEKIYSYTIEPGKEDKLPSAERMKEILAQADATPVSPSYPEFAKINLDVNIPHVHTAAGEDAPGVYRTKIQNGPEIIRVKSEPVKASNHLVIKAVFDTGFKTLPQDKMESARIAASFIDRNFGFRNCSRKELRDNPETGDVSVMMEINRDESEITVLCGKDDTQKAFKMLYLLLTEPYFDTEKNLARFKATQIKSLEKGGSEKSAFDKEDRRMRYNDHPWRKELEKEHFQALSMDLIKDVYKRSFCDFNRLKLYVCDDLSSEDMTLLYDMMHALAADPYVAEAAEELPSWPLYSGNCQNIKESPLSTVPKSEVKLSYKYGLKLKNEEFVISDIMDYIMNARCMNKIREERGGTYSVTFMTETFLQGGVAESVIAFQTRPELTDILVDDAQTIVADMAAKGPTKEEFENARKYLAKHYVELEARYRNNLSRKLDRFMTKDRYGVDEHTDYLKMLEKASRKDVRKLGVKMVKGDTMLSVYTEK